jgi:hypothetical protein
MAALDVSLNGFFRNTSLQEIQNDLHIKRLGAQDSGKQ